MTKGTGIMTTIVRVSTVCALVLATTVIGCARRPSMTSMSSPPPTAATSSTETADAAPKEAIIVEERSEIVVVERPAPSTFTENANVKPIYFDFDKYAIRPGDAKILETDATWVEQNDMLLLIEGQCDERGTDE